MENIRIIIVEDNIPYAIDLEMNLKEWGHEILGIFENGEEALNAILKYRPDLVLMDIDVKGKLDGIDIGKKIKAYNIPIIYMTGLTDKDYFENAQETDGISYLVKPFDMLSLKGAIQMAFPIHENKNNRLNNFSLVDNSIFIKRGDEYQKVPIDSILWIESDKNYCVVHCESKKFVLKSTMKNLLVQLGKAIFVRIHKTYAIKLESIDKVSISRNEVIIKEKALPIGRVYKEDLLTKLKMLH